MTAPPTTFDCTRSGTVATAAPPAAGGRWRIDAGASSLRISVKVGFVATVTGRFTRMSGHVHVAADAAASRIDATVDTDSLTSGNSSWDSVLIDAGLVDTAANPTVSFRSTCLRPAGEE